MDSMMSMGCLSVPVYRPWIFLTTGFQQNNFCLRFWPKWKILLLFTCRITNLPRRFRITAKQSFAKYPPSSTSMTNLSSRMSIDMLWPGDEEVWNRSERRGLCTGRSRRISRRGSMRNLGLWWRELGRRVRGIGLGLSLARVIARIDRLRRVLKHISRQLSAMRTVRKVPRNSQNQLAKKLQANPTVRRPRANREKSNPRKRATTLTS